VNGTGYTKMLLEEDQANKTEKYIQLPNFRGQACTSMGKSSKCIGHSACIVNLKQRTENEIKQKCH
jgi:hypothetical protein